MIHVSNLKMSYKISTLILLLLSIDLQSQDIPASAMEILEQNPNLLDRLENDDFSQDFTNNEESLDFSVDELVPGAGPTKSNIFGMNYINSIPTSISATSDLPLSNDYVLTFGDKLKVIFTGSKKSIFTVQVNLDGTVLFPELGSVYVAGESFGDVKRKIRNMVDVSYVGVDVDLSVQSITARKINIIGAVKNPGTYLVSPFSTITSALAYSGGFEEYASLRNVKVIRGNEEFIFDLYDLLIFGSREGDVNIQQGDTIFISSTNNFINVRGQVKRPFIYQFKPDETIRDLINFAMGTDSVANENNIAVNHYSDGLEKIQTTEVSLEDDIALSNFKNPISVEVFTINSSTEFEVSVSGPVENVGNYKVSENSDLGSLIKELRFTNSVNPFIGVLQKGNYSKLFSLNDKSTQNLELSNNTEILFFGRESILDDSRLSANSRVMLNDYMLNVSYRGRTVLFPFFGSIEAIQVIDYLGLDTTDIDEFKTTLISPLDDLVVVDSFKNLKFKAKKYNSLSFRHLSDQTINVSVSGEAELPGNYILNSNTSLMDLYELIGGLSESADENIVVFKRASVREQNIKAIEESRRQLTEFFISNLQDGDNVQQEFVELLYYQIDEQDLGRISGDFGINSRDINNFFLQDGDSIFIPKKLSTVSVIGEVQNPSTFLHKPNLNIRSVINKAGGYKQFALKRSVYVIRANGEIERSRGIFQKNLKIYPGDTVVVPRDINIREDWITRVVPLTSILSNLAFSAAALDSLQE